MTGFKRVDRRFSQAAGVVIMAAVLAVCTMPLTAFATVQERPPEIPESELIKKDTIPASYQGDGAQKPQGEDFTWVYDVQDIFAVPAGAKSLTTQDEVKGPWKVFMVGEPTEAFCFYNVFNMNINDLGAGGVALATTWYKQTLVTRKTNEATVLDSSGLASEIYDGSMDNGILYAADPDSDIINRFMFANGEFIDEFLFVNFYQIEDRQYALGVVYTDNEKFIGNVFMTRRVNSYVGTTSTGSTSTDNTSTGNTSTDSGKTVGISFHDWSWFEGYWVNAYEDGRDSIYIQAIDPLSAYVVIADESIGVMRGLKATVTYDSNNEKITLLYPDGSVSDVMEKDDYYGHEAVKLDGYNGLMFRGNKSDHAQDYWNYIADKFKGSDEWYD